MFHQISIKARTDDKRLCPQLSTHTHQLKYMELMLPLTVCLWIITISSRVTILRKNHTLGIRVNMSKYLRLTTIDRTRAVQELVDLAEQKLSWQLLVLSSSQFKLIRSQRWIKDNMKTYTKRNWMGRSRFTISNRFHKKFIKHRKTKIRIKDMALNLNRTFSRDLPAAQTMDQTHPHSFQVLTTHIG